MMKNLPDLIEDFLRYLKVQRGRTALTVRNYRLYLKRFLSWSSLGRLRVAADLTRERLRDYRLWLSHQRGTGGNTLSTATQNYHLTALRSFVTYLKHKDVDTLPAQAITLHTAEQRPILVLSQEELAALRLAVAESHEPPLVKLRDRTIMELIIVSGLKVSELVSLVRDQLKLDSGEFTLKRQGQAATLRLGAEVCQLLKTYLQARTDRSSALFVRHDRAAQNQAPERLTPRSVQRSLERYRKLAGLKQKVTPHTLRHSFALALTREGADLKTMRERLGLKHGTAVRAYRAADKPTSR